MLVIDYPSAWDDPVNLGTFVIIELDPVESVADLCDEEATRQASEMEPLRCLALVFLPGEMVASDKAGGMQLSLKFKLAGRGLPDPPTSWAATPIAPAPPHPETGRPAVQPSYPLPWDDCYIHTVKSLVARVSRIYQHRTPGPSFSEPLFREIRRRAGRDSRENGERRNAAALAASPPAPGIPDAPVLPVPPVVEHEPNAPVNQGDDLRENFPGLFSDGTPTVNVYVQMWVQISAADQLCRPEDFSKGLRRLGEIEEEWAQRTIAALMSKKPQTTAWLEGTAGADAPPSDDDDNDAIVIDDDSIGPEDAIEHRIEREMAADSMEQPAPANPIAEPHEQRSSEEADVQDNIPLAHESLTSQPILEPPASSACSAATDTPSADLSSEQESSCTSQASRIAPSRDDYSSHSIWYYSPRNLALRMKHLFLWISGWFGRERIAARSRSFFWALLWRKPFST